MKLELQLYGSSALRCKARPVAEVTQSVRRLVADMLDTMHMEKGIGLAAEQVGSDLAVCVVDVPEEYDRSPAGGRLNPDLKMPLVLINPRIVEASPQRVTAEEGCLSFPGIYLPISRPEEVTVSFLDRNGHARQVHCRGLVSRAVQHEMDHLAGILIVDRVSPWRRVRILHRLLRLKRRGKRQTVPPGIPRSDSLATSSSAATPERDG